MEELKRQLKRAFWFTVAVVFLIESWLWDNVKEWLRALSQTLGIERLEPWLRDLVAKLTPQMTLALFAAPAVAILPFKLLAFELIANGHVLSGLLAIFLAKTLALGVTAYLFDICRDKLLQMEWFGRFYSIVLDARAWAHALVAPFKAQALEIAEAIRSQIVAFVGDERFGFGRRLSRLRELARPKRSA